MSGKSSGRNNPPSGASPASTALENVCGGAWPRVERNLMPLYAAPAEGGNGKAFDRAVS
jgi:hypothetical protein